MGVFLTFEGIDGCGKSTQIELLRRKLKEKHVETCVTREPGGTEAGRLIRKILLGTSCNINEYAQLFMFLADRVQHLEEVIRPALKEGRWVLCDRFVESTVAYQGYGLGVSIDFIQYIHREILNNTWPDATLLIDCPVKEARKRLKIRLKGPAGGTKSDFDDRYEKRSFEFQERLRNGYLELAKRHPERIFLLDGTKDPHVVHKEIVRVLHKKKLWPSEI